MGRLCLLCGPVLAGLFLSCGIEDYYYLTPVPVGNITLITNLRANILLSSMSVSYFTNFAIYYRIYISESNESGEIQTSPTSLSNINSTLNSDYSFFNNYTTSNTMVGTSVGSLFRNRSYYPLATSAGSLDRLLDDNSPGRMVTLNFQDAPATITLSGSPSYPLYRSGEVLSPSPSDRLFYNSSDLLSSANTISTVNADVANLTNATGAQRYGYVSLYIVAVGIDLITYAQIYSNPTFIGIMRLPD
jgi:hypothetical protein